MLDWEAIELSPRPHTSFDPETCNHYDNDCLDAIRSSIFREHRTAGTIRWPFQRDTNIRFEICFVLKRVMWKLLPLAGL